MARTCLKSMRQYARLTNQLVKIIKEVDVTDRLVDDELDEVADAFLAWRGTRMKTQSSSRNRSENGGELTRGFSSLQLYTLEMHSRGSSFDVRRLGDYASSVYMPGRLKALQSPRERNPLRIYAHMTYLSSCRPAHTISPFQERRSDDYIVEPGVILQTRSGRNLGPATMTDEYLTTFALSDDLIRIRIADEIEKYYTLAFIKSDAGQVLLRSSNNGSVINHLNVDSVSNLPIAFLEGVVDTSARLMKESVRLRGEARRELSNAILKLNERYPLPATKLSQGWEVSAALLGSRIDAAAHSERVREIRKMLLDDGGVLVAQIAKVSKPGGRPKLVYVEKGNGTPICLDDRFCKRRL